MGQLRNAVLVWEEPCCFRSHFLHLDRVDRFRGRLLGLIHLFPLVLNDEAEWELLLAPVGESSIWVLTSGLWLLLSVGSRRREIGVGSTEHAPVFGLVIAGQGSASRAQRKDWPESGFSLLVRFNSVHLSIWTNNLLLSLRHRATRQAIQALLPNQHILVNFLKFQNLRVHLSKRSLDNLKVGRHMNKVLVKKRNLELMVL